MVQGQPVYTFPWIPSVGTINFRVCQDVGTNRGWDKTTVGSINVTTLSHSCAHLASNTFSVNKQKSVKDCYKSTWTNPYCMIAWSYDCNTSHLNKVSLHTEACTTQAIVLLHLELRPSNYCACVLCGNYLRAGLFCSALAKESVWE